MIATLRAKEQSRNSMSLLLKVEKTQEVLHSDLNISPILTVSSKQQGREKKRERDNVTSPTHYVLVTISVLALCRKICLSHPSS